MTYTFKCRKCGYKFDKRGIVIEERDTVKVPCPECGGATKRVMHNEIRFSFGDNINSTISTKSDSYWENAEQNRLANLDRARRERFEKVKGGDKEETAKLRRRIENQERLGKMMDDKARLQEAKELRSILGDE